MANKKGAVGYRFIFFLAIFWGLMFTWFSFFDIEGGPNFEIDDPAYRDEPTILNFGDKVSLMFKIAFFGIESALIPQWLALLVTFILSIPMVYITIWLISHFVPFT